MALTQHQGANRLRELGQRLAKVRAEIDAAALAAGRDPHSVRLVVVSKTWPEVDLRALYDLGVRDFAENRLQEAQAKADALPSDITWHMIGQVQTKKAGAVCRFADVLHSVDRPRLVSALAQRCQDRKHPLDCLIQVRISGAEPNQDDRGGVLPDQADELADAISSAAHLKLRGVMSLPDQDIEAQTAFEILAATSQRLQQQHPDASWISAGMSHDFAQAIAAGATHVRIGTAVFGPRQNLR